MQNPIALMTAKLNAFANGLFLRLLNIVTGLVIVIVAWFGPASCWFARAHQHPLDSDHLRGRRFCAHFGGMDTRVIRK